MFNIYCICSDPPNTNIFVMKLKQKQHHASSNNIVHLAQKYFKKWPKYRYNSIFINECKMVYKIQNYIHMVVLT